jgi:phosphatidate cytidylyltransferase
MGAQFKQRIIMSALSITCLAFAIYYSHTIWFEPFFVLLSALIICTSLHEYYKLAHHKGYQPLIKTGLCCAALYILTSYLNLKYAFFNGIPLFVLLGSLIVFFLEFCRNQHKPLVNIAITAFGLIYLALPLTCLLLINYFQSADSDHGSLWLAYVLTVTKITDMGGYAFGKTMGKTKLAGSISPNKTVEGALGGMFVSLCASLAFYYYFFPTEMHFTLWQSIWLGLITSILAQFGDLAESVLKRDAGVKDSSHVPGLGGILDIVDSLVFTLPFMYLLLKMHLIG